MQPTTGRLIGGNHHGERFQLPLSGEHLAFIETGDRYSAFIMAAPDDIEARSYLISKELLDEQGRITDKAITYIADNDLWSWGAA